MEGEVSYEGGQKISAGNSDFPFVPSAMIYDVRTPPEDPTGIKRYIITYFDGLKD